MFASWTAASLGRSMSAADPDLSAGAPGAPDDARAYDSTRLAKLEDTLKRYEDHFNRHLRILLDRYVTQTQR
jgi:gamma-tubulin complex component 2